ncbi:MAG: alpha/beta fold hydrolase [Bacteroidota bacterium]
MAEVRANGISIHYQSIGQGDVPPVVFIHGLVFDDLSSWYFLAGAKLSHRARVVVYDLRGHGKSEHTPTGYGLRQQVADLKGLLDELEIETVRLVGNSLGGLIALAFAASYPDRVDRLVVIDSSAGEDGWGDAMARAVSQTDDAAQSKVPHWFAPWAHRYSGRKSNRLVKTATRLARETTLSADLRASPTLSDRQLAQITCPTLAIYGADSSFLASGQRLQRVLPGCTLHQIEGASHSVVHEATSAIYDAIEPFVAPPRYLFVAPPLTGHINPMVSVAEASRAQGADIAWAGHPTALGRSVPPDHTLYPLDEPDQLSGTVASQALGSAVGYQRYKHLIEDVYVPLAEAMVAGVAEATRVFRPDAIIADQYAYAGAIVAEQCGLPWVTSAPSGTSVIDNLASVPKVRAWRDDALAELASSHGVDRPIFMSPTLALAYTLPDLVAGPLLDGPIEFVGPAFTHRSDAVAFPWDALDDRPLVFVTLGTVHSDAGDRFFREVLAAARDWDIQFVLVAPERFADEAPDHVIVRPYVPQIEILQRADAVVCHGGYNTTLEALAHGVPLVVAPIGDDQPTVAEAVVSAGVGVRLKFRRARAPQIRNAISEVLTVPSYRESAERLRQRIGASGGAQAAAALIYRRIRESMRKPQVA